MNNRRSCVLILQFGVMNGMGPYRLLFTTFLSLHSLGYNQVCNLQAVLDYSQFASSPFQLQ